MIFRETGLEGLVVIELEPLVDERGSFARVFDAQEWTARGMAALVAQRSVSRNLVRGTLRGMHYQEAPFAETKLVRCSRGAVHDVAVDLRPDSATYCRSFGIELSEHNDLMLSIPEGFAHGFLTLADGAEIEYQMSEYYEPGSGRGVRWDDPAFGIEWPARPTLISERDRTYPDFQP
jgi:dTDP-4-dehydrorhamnose 3,5-epimerase